MKADIQKYATHKDQTFHSIVSSEETIWMKLLVLFYMKIKKKNHLFPFDDLA